MLSFFIWSIYRGKGGKEGKGGKREKGGGVSHQVHTRQREIKKKRDEDRERYFIMIVFQLND